jgi:hypothetical protein
LRLRSDAASKRGVRRDLALSHQNVALPFRANLHETLASRAEDLSAGGFAPGAEDQVRRVLDDLVVRTNERAELDVKASAERKESKREAAEKLQQDAEGATTRFRSES